MEDLGPTPQVTAKREFWNVRLAWLRYAAAWLGVACLRTMVLLPFRWQLALGKALGRAALKLLPERRLIADRNLAVCFPAMPRVDREALVHAHFEALGASVVEMAMGWFGSAQRVRRLIRVEGAEHLAAALARGKGVILFSAHFTTFELFWPALAPLCSELCGMYKSQRNPVMNKVMTAGRGRNYSELFAKDNVRAMLRSLRRNAVVWYATDQSFTGKGSSLVPFFGEPAMTNTAVSRIAKVSGAAVLPYFCRRQDDADYVMSIGAPIEGLPSGDEVEDMNKFTRLLEAYIRTCPAQYWWIHQRFKGRPAPYPDIYGAATPTAERP
jgi:Kdo2-lipid IVA lauroyltransferase/acyltransferase